MKKTLYTIVLLLQAAVAHIAAQDTLWVRYDNRFRSNQVVKMADTDSIVFKTTQVKAGTRNVTLPTDQASLMFRNPGRWLLKPNTYSGTNYENAKATSGYNFAHSLESEHFAVFWDARFGNNPSKISIGGYTASANDILDVAEKCWKTYVEELGFLIPGKSTTDKYKIQLYVPYQSDWRADASGTDGQDANGTWGKTGIGHFNPWAATARGGHTIAHEVGHTFQYLVGADLGSDHGYGWGFNGDGWGDCGWWESCADWQAYQIFPERQFTDGEYFEQHLDCHHLNLLHEDWRYACCYVQDWWCMKYGRDFIGRMWRASNKSEDPVQTYKRINKLTQTQFNDEMMEGCMRMATWDIDGVRDRAKHRIGQHKNFLKLVDKTQGVYQIDSAHCIQNYGYSIINMTRPTAGTVVKANFKGLTDAKGYRYVKKNNAGWRYAFVAMQSDGTRHYGEVQADKEGVAELTVPEKCNYLFFVVMGAPTTHWQHPWDRSKDAASWTQNNEQWPYQVIFENTKPR